MDIKIKYDGAYPNLCSGDLIVYIDRRKWNFGNCLSSGGSVSFDENWSEEIEDGEWSITDWPEDFPEECQEAVISAVNSSVSWGCCGGCV